MTTNHQAQLSDERIAAVRASGAGYAPDAAQAEADMRANLNRAAAMLGWNDEAEAARGAFGRVIPKGARVVVKPNFVLHANQAPYGIEPLITHASLVRAAVEEALRAGAGEVVVGDAPVQGCDFDELLRATGLGAWASEVKKRESRFVGIEDFRRTVCVYTNGVRQADENRISEDAFVLFDLAHESLLEPITDDQARFRVTCYDPRLLAKRHAPGRHQYLIARRMLDADVVINLPKLKTHKKAGVTCALKNLIGINGNKEFLPHHRVGAPGVRGDCYPRDNRAKRLLEYALDRQNTTARRASAKFWELLATQMHRALHLQRDELGVEGSWSGNDTIWRTCLDLNRILLYGRADGTMADEPQRQVLHIVDAIIAGQGDGPLAAEPLPMNLILAGANAAAMDAVAARLLNYRPHLIPITREAFNPFRWSLTAFQMSEVALVGDLGTGAFAETLARATLPAVKHPHGWRDAAHDDARRDMHGFAPGTSDDAATTITQRA